MESDSCGLRKRMMVVDSQTYNNSGKSGGVQVENDSSGLQTESKYGGL